MARLPNDERLPRHALWKKIELLKERTPAKGDCAAGTWEAFKAFTGVSRETLKAGCPKDEDGKFERQAISSASEQALGLAFGFSRTCPTWTHGTVAEFAAKHFPVVAVRDGPRLVAERIAERIGSIDPGQRLTVALFLRRQEADPGNQPFDAELVAQVFTQVGVRLAVVRGTLKVVCRPDLVPPMTQRLGGDDGVVSFERRANTITLSPGGQDHMNWAVEATSAPIGVVSRELVGLFKLAGVQAGDELDISFLVEDRDLVDAEDGQPVSAGIAVETDDGAAADSAVVLPTGAPLGPAKRKLMAHIAKASMGLFGAQRRGTAVLCRYAIRIVEEEGTAEAKP